MALDGLQAHLNQELTRSQQELDRKRLNFVRYADDFIVTGHSKEFLEQEVKPCIATFLAERGLTLSAEKTRVTSIEEGFDFLGFNVRRIGNKLLIRPAQKSINSLYVKLKEIVKSSSTAKQVDLINRLNPVVRGWVHYHRHVVAKEIFAQVERYLWHLLWRWAKRRHPNKGLKWIKAKYFRRIAHRDWIFAAKDEKTRETITLVNASDTRIRRHIKIRSDANPYDPAWNDYFEQRKYRRFRN